MTETEFQKEFHKLEAPFRYLARDEESRKAREAAYWLVVQTFTWEQWKRVVILILEQWTDDSLPLPSVVKAYLVDESKRGQRHAPAADCGLCEGTGWKLIEKDGIRRASECDCVRI